jgi:hypothetical protein
VGKKYAFKGRFIGVGQIEIGEIARRLERNLASDLRLWLLALARMNDAGHAAFEPTHRKPDGMEEPGELRRLLGRIDVQGELFPLSAKQVYNIKRELAAAGLLVDASGGETCVWVAYNVAQRVGVGNTMCPYHRNRQRGYSDP